MLSVHEPDHPPILTDAKPKVDIPDFPTEGKWVVRDMSKCVRCHTSDPGGLLAASTPYHLCTCVLGVLAAYHVPTVSGAGRPAGFTYMRSRYTRRLTRVADGILRALRRFLSCPRDGNREAVYQEVWPWIGELATDRRAGRSHWPWKRRQQGCCQVRIGKFKGRADVL